jgi:hypothetical protein
MNRVKFVPKDARARAANPLALQIVVIDDRKGTVYHKPLFSKGSAELLRAPSLREAVIMASAQGWMRLSDLSPAERRDWRELYVQHRKGQEHGGA